MNAASNIVNQIADLEIDRRNKPDRPLVTGEIAIRRAWIVAAALYVLAIVPTWLVVPYPYETLSARMSAPLHLHAAFFIYLVGALATFVYSFPAFGRTKRHWFAANFTIAVTRGGLLKVAGWSFVASVLWGEAWSIGGIFALFLLGATSTKDFSDMEGDRAHGCITLPIRFGVAKAAKIMAPFFVVPWLLIPALTWLPGGARPDRQPDLPDGARNRPRALGRLHGEAPPAKPRGARLDREPPGLDPHVPDAHVRAGGIRGRVPGVAAIRDARSRDAGSLGLLDDRWPPRRRRKIEAS